MTKYGLLIADDGSSVDDGNVKYDSGLGHLSVDLFATPKHFDIIKVVGTNIPIDGTPRYEVLAKIEHNMPFTPIVSTYFYLDKEHADPAVIPSAYKYESSFYKNFFPLRNLGGPGVDAYVTSVDETYLEIGHFGVHYLGGSLTSPAASIPAFCKYYIYNTQGYNRRGDITPLG